MVHFSSCIGQNLAAARLMKMFFGSHAAARNAAILGIGKRLEGSRLHISGPVFLTLLAKSVSYGLALLWPCHSRVPRVEREKLLCKNLYCTILFVYTCTWRSERILLIVLLSLDE